MKELRDVIVTWVDQRIEDMLSAPRMWGSDEAIELQMLLLLELRALALRPEEITADPRRILDAYAAYLAKTYPKTPNRPLCQIIETDHSGLRLAAELRKFKNQLVSLDLDTVKKPAINEALGAKPTKSHSTKNVVRNNPWAKVDAIAHTLTVPPRMGMAPSVRGGPL
jgi:hypothetical protein